MWMGVCECVWMCWCVSVCTLFVEILARIYFRAPSTKPQNSVLIFAQFRANILLKQLLDIYIIYKIQNYNLIINYTLYKNLSTKFNKIDSKNKIDLNGRRQKYLRLDQNFILFWFLKMFYFFIIYTVPPFDYDPTQSSKKVATPYWRQKLVFSNRVKPCTLPCPIAGGGGRYFTKNRF